jgi:hypothetical protein
MDRYKLYDQIHAADDQLTREHLLGFVRSFVKSQKRDRWVGLVQGPLSKAYKHSAKLLSDLSFDKAIRIKSPDAISPFREGVYWEFDEQGFVISPEEAFVLGANRDAIYSMSNGELALFFSHEGDVYLFDNQ